MKAQKRPGVKASGQENTRINLRLSLEASRRLWVTAIMSGQTASAIVEGLIAEGLKSWSMPANLSARATRVMTSHSATLDAPVESPAEIAA